MKERSERQSRISVKQSIHSSVIGCSSDGYVPVRIGRVMLERPASEVGKTERRYLLP
jgi:hypothetical protein